VEVTRELRGVVDRLLGGSGPQTLAAPKIPAGHVRSLGRAPACDYVIRDPTVSSRHAELVRLDDDGWLIRDLGSRNGTRVNGWLVKEQRLRDGDTLTFGGSVFLFDAR
jgi:pSer/pThr/pTyr-binding forkhead associated (FHA) protein